MTPGKPTLTEVEAADRIREFEKRHDAFSICEDGISLWRLLRFEVSMQLQNLALQRPPIPRSQLLLTLPRATWQYAMARGSYRYIGKTSSSALRDRRDNTYRDMYFGDLVDEVPGGGLFSSIDAPGFAQNRRHAQSKPVFDDTAILIGSAIMGRLFGRHSPSAASVKLASAISKGLGLVEFTPRRIQRKYDVFRYRAGMYRRVLARFRVENVFASNTGLFALIEAARRLGIPYVEVQHGNFGPHHPDAIPASALCADRASLLLPDRLAVFGSRDVERLSDTALGQLGRLHMVGAPAIAKGRTIRETRFRADPTCPVITFTSQGFGRNEVCQFIADFLSTSSCPLRFNVRLHPGYDGDGTDYRDIAARDPRLVVMDGSAMPPTYEIIALSDLHLSISSACHLDAIGMATPTAVLDLPGHAGMMELVEAGTASLVRSAEHLVQMVEQRQWGTVAPEQSSYFFQPGYIQNMLELLEARTKVAQ